jgi:hypothetical protein
MKKCALLALTATFMAAAGSHADSIPVADSFPYHASVDIYDNSGGAHKTGDAIAFGTSAYGDAVAQNVPGALLTLVPYISFISSVSETATWQDNIVLTPHLPGLLAPDSLILHFTLFGTLPPTKQNSDLPFFQLNAFSSTGVPDTISAASNGLWIDDFSNTAYVQSPGAEVESFLVRSSDDPNDNKFFCFARFAVTATAWQDAPFVFPFNFTVAAYWLAGFAGPSYPSQSITELVHLDEITLPNSRTPEQAGYGVSFESGMQSPNTVPEPASYVHLAVGTVVLLSVAWRRGSRVTQLVHQ